MSSVTDAETALRAAVQTAGDVNQKLRDKSQRVDKIASSVASHQAIIH